MKISIPNLLCHFEDTEFFIEGSFLMHTVGLFIGVDMCSVTSVSDE